MICASPTFDAHAKAFQDGLDCVEHMRLLKYLGRRVQGLDAFVQATQVPLVSRQLCDLLAQRKDLTSTLGQVPEEALVGVGQRCARLIGHFLLTLRYRRNRS
jgi:hypothetical protein